MKMMQVISDYIRRSILTTQGDIAVRGAAIPERFAAGAIKTFLAGQGVGAIPAWAGHKLSDHGMATGVFVQTSTGNRVITGLGFRPSLLIILASDSPYTKHNSSICIDNGTNRIILINDKDGGRSWTHNANSVRIERADGDNVIGTVTVISNDGFTISFAREGLASARTYWFAIE